MVKRFKLDTRQVLEPQTWVVVMVLSILVGIIMICIFTIFVYNQKTLQLYRLQNNFINNFTHELKTPVTSLKLYLETFLKHELPRKDQLKYINYMIQDAERLTDNINQILNLARIESKNYSEETVIMDLVESTEEFIIHNEHLFRNSNIEVVNPTGRAFTYSMNALLFDMFMMNLLTNAIKYNNSEKPVINIEFKPLKYKLLIKFQDNGIGIEKSEIKNIFKKFYQVGSSDNRSAKGSGLGLYMAENIAKIYKGRIKAESKGIGKGSEFSLILPYDPTLN